MKTFNLKADATLEAEDIEAAFRELGKYYQELGEGKRPSTSVFTGGQVSLSPVEEKI